LACEAVQARTIAKFFFIAPLLPSFRDGALNIARHFLDSKTEKPMALSKAEQDYRVGKFTGSLANAVMTAKSEDELIKIWRQKVGLDPPVEETYAMRAGTYMEPFILNELEVRSGNTITRRGEIVDHPEIADICVKLDGYCRASDTVVEVKFLAPWRSRDEFYAAYYAQCILQMLCTGARNAILLVAQGTSEPIEHEILFDQDYADELMLRAKAFLLCMRTLTPPYPEPPIVPREKWRTLDLDQEETNWSAELLTHLEHHEATTEAANMHDMAGTAARKLIPDDVGKVLIQSWQITRDKRGTLSIRKRKPA
jgi:YqaJ-like viral recombinase domain